MGGTQSRSGDGEEVRIGDAREILESEEDTTPVEMQMKENNEKPLAALRRELLEARESELRSIEASQIEEVQRQVEELEAAYDFVRPPPIPRCVAEEDAVVQCYQKQLEDGQDVLKCAALVSAYSTCAQKVAAELAAAVSESSAPSK